MTNRFVLERKTAVYVFIMLNADLGKLQSEISLTDVKRPVPPRYVRRDQLGDVTECPDHFWGIG